MSKEAKFSQEEFKEALKAFSTFSKYCDTKDIVLCINSLPKQGSHFITSIELKVRKRGAIRHKVFNKIDQSNSKCAHCGSKDKLVADHVYPFSKGGTDDESNLQILCARCNSFKSDDSDERLKSGDIAFDMVKYYLDKIKNPSKEPYTYTKFATRKEYLLNKLNSIYIPPHRKSEYYELVKTAI